MSENVTLRGFSRGRNRRDGFTLVELLVVIGIIALLIGILLPSLSKARKAAQETLDMNNMRQWGFGFMMYADSNHGALPSDGAHGTSGDPIVAYAGDPTATPPKPPTFSLDSSANWFNAIPPYVAQKSYVAALYADANGLTTLAHAGSNSIFVCPAANDAGSTQSAEIYPGGGYFKVYGTITDANYAKPYGPTGKGLNVGSVSTYKNYFCYVMNSKIFTTGSDGNPYYAWKLSQLSPSSSTVLMVEKLMNPGEYKLAAVLNTANSGATAAAGYTGNIGQMKACWNRFTTRHRGGGFLLFADGHVAWSPWKQLQPSNSASAINSNTNAGANQPGLGIIWNPRTQVGTSTGTSD